MKLNMKTNHLFLHHHHQVVICMVIILITIVLNYGNLIIVTEAAPSHSLITQLPGFTGSFPSKHYSGYITLQGHRNNGSVPKNLFYYFVESERNPHKDPVVLWLNGGPGCSSFDGFIYEHGPFNFQPGNTKSSLPLLHLNPYSWSKVSNIIYLDSPTGVGLSYSENQITYQTGDIQTARDSHSFLLQWFKQFPEFSKNPFYVAGESYGGIYVPTLAAKIVEGLKDNKVNPTINFKGYMVGNGVTAEQKYDGNALLPFAHGMALISDDLYREFTTSCGMNIDDDGVAECNDYRNKLYQAIEGLNIYDILEPCYHRPENGKTKNLSLPDSFKQLGATEKFLPVRKRMYGRAWPYQMVVKDGLVPSWPQLNSIQNDRRVNVPCTSEEVASAWLNSESVRKAIHAKPVNMIGDWSLCMSLQYNHDAGSMIKYHRNLTSQGFKALIYSGDHDLCVPYTGTQAWTSSLGYRVLDEWRPWKSNDQVAGYVQAYDHNLTFLTVKGAGHTVPEYKPREAFDFFSRWLEGKPI